MKMLLKFGLLYVIFVDYVQPLPLVQDEKPPEDARFWIDKGKKELKKRLEIDLLATKTGAKNVILFVGDGMGIAPTVAARIYKGQKEGSPYGGEEAELIWETFPYTGLSKTYNTDYQVSDSAGTATAIFTGVKTRLGVLGIDGTPMFGSCDPELVEKSKLKSMLHKAIDQKKATGFVTTARITHATPGALYSHIQHRDWEADTLIPEIHRYKNCPDIAYQLIYNEVGQKINVIMGGGMKMFKLKNESGVREDEDLINTWVEKKASQNKNASLLRNTGDLDKWLDNMSDYTLGIFSNSHLTYEAERNKNPDGEPSLSQMVTASIKRLQKNPNGFFLMVESGLIDLAHHNTNAKRALEETVELDEAVQAALGLVNLKETLVIVTADHSHSLTINGYPKRGNPILGYVFEESRLNFMTQPDGSIAPYTTLSYANGLGFLQHFTGNGDRPWKDVSKDFSTPIEDDLDFQQPTMWRGPEDYETHGGEDVGIFAIGPMSHLFVGVHEQNYIAHVVDHATDVWRKEREAHKPMTTKSSSNKNSFCHAIVTLMVTITATASRLT